MNTVRGLALALPLLAAPALAQQPAGQPEVDLKLFDKAEVDRSKGCTVTLWQANRDPEKDRYAILFNEQLVGRNNNRQPAKMKIGAEVVALTRVAVGGKSPGYGLYPHQLYRLPGDGDFVIMDLKLAEEMGEAVEIESGSLSVVVKGRQVFRASVKGGAGCMGAQLPDPPRQAAASAPPPQAPARPPAASAPPPAAAEGPGMFERYAVRGALPPAIGRAAQKFGCEAKTLAGPIAGFQTSEESAIWQIPCADYGDRKSFVFALVYVPDPGKQHTFLPFKFPKSHVRGIGEHPMMAPVWDAKAAIVTSINLFNGTKDCGTLERHRVTPEGGFQLIELRVREQCDGKAVGAENFPLIFRGR